MFYSIEEPTGRMAITLNSLCRVNPETGGMQREANT